MTKYRRQPNEKKNFRESNVVAIRNTLGREVQCPNFSSFYGERKNARQRCLLPEYHDEKGKPYFSSKESEKICAHFDSKKGCGYQEHLLTKTDAEKKDKIIISLLRKTRELESALEELDSPKQ